VVPVLVEDVAGRSSPRRARRARCAVTKVRAISTSAWSLRVTMAWKPAPIANR
jgi:hypothetical protein